MLDIRAGLQTYRFWREFEQTCSENCRKIDVETLRDDLSSRRGGIDETLATLRDEGIAVIKDYWPAEKCSAARDEIDRLIAEYPVAVKIFSGGSDKRMFGVEQVSSLLSEFHSDRFLHGMGEMMGGLAIYNFATLGARIDATSENNGSGDGWHRDSHGSQFKSILYLSDVSEQNGPFEFLPGSHKRWRAALDTTVGGLPAPPSSRYDVLAVDRMVLRFGIRRRRYAAKAGTLLLVNTSGIHRGSPLNSGSRYALTNYYYHPFQVGEGRIEQFAPMMPGVAERIRDDLSIGAS
jgi:hypothetical protein